MAAEPFRMTAATQARARQSALDLLKIDLAAGVPEMTAYTRFNASMTAIRTLEAPEKTLVSIGER